MMLTLSRDQIERAADALVHARTHNIVIDGLPGDALPKSLSDAYAIQDRLIERLGAPIGGWFCACTNPEIQRLLGLQDPYFARLLKSKILVSPARIVAAEMPPMVVETEFAFLLAKDMPAREGLYTRAEVEAAIASVHPSIEVVAGYLKSWQTQDVFSVIADNGTDGALVYGSGTTTWRDNDLASVEVQLYVNGTLKQIGCGANVLGDPVEAFVWLVNARSAAGDGLKAGQIHNTGTATSMQSVQAGDEVVATFLGIGSAAMLVI